MVDTKTDCSGNTRTGQLSGHLRLLWKRERERERVREREREKELYKIS